MHCGLLGDMVRQGGICRVQEKEEGCNFLRHRDAKSGCKWYHEHQTCDMDEATMVELLEKDAKSFQEQSLINDACKKFTSKNDCSGFCAFDSNTNTCVSQSASDRDLHSSSAVVREFFAVWETST